VGIGLGGKFEAVYARVVHVGENDSLLRGFEIRGYRVVCFISLGIMWFLILFGYLDP
jgi:hypothetical protein